MYLEGVVDEDVLDYGGEAVGISFGGTDRERRGRHKKTSIALLLTVFVLSH